MGDRKQPERTAALMAAVELLIKETPAIVYICDLDEAEKIDAMAGLVGPAARRRVRISLEQGYGKSMPRKERLTRAKTWVDGG